VGKTELSKALAEFLFDDEDAMVRVDMSEYQERHTVSRLVGAPPGYIGYGEGGQLTEAVRRRPYQVVLFDEIEKAHQDVWNTLLQILEEGRMTDGQGRTVDFQNTVVIMTSNVGTSFTQRGGSVGFRAGDRSDEQVVVDEKIRDDLKRTFRPEFLNRVDEIIVFHDLTLDHIREIVDLQTRDIQGRLSEHGIVIELTESATDWLANEGYDPKFGARPLRRTLQRQVETPLSRKILEGELEAGATVLVDADAKEGIKFKMGENRGDPA
jgi:ATP-dependent Clp protease ATP-binding subunit ClpC